MEVKFNSIGETPEIKKGSKSDSYADGNVQSDEVKWDFNSYEGVVIPKKKRKSRPKKPKQPKNEMAGQETLFDVPEKAPTTEKVDNQAIINIPRPENFFVAAAVQRSKTEYIEKSKQLEYDRLHPYVKADNILTNAEATLYRMMLKEFNSKLSSIGKSILIFPKLRMADLIETKESMRAKETRAFYKIACKHIDYIVCDSETFKVIMAVELDDAYHYRSEKIARDNFVNDTLRECGIQLFRVDKLINKLRPDDLGNMVDFILEQYAPNCPHCGKIMQLNKSRQNFNYGHRFFGCTGFYSKTDRCTFTLDID